MSKVLKTGDVKRYPRYDYASHWGWSTVVDGFGITGMARSRRLARIIKHDYERIARVLSIGPKLVTVRIEK